jgi:hypothetical protein
MQRLDHLDTHKNRYYEKSSKPATEDDLGIPVESFSADIDRCLKDPLEKFYKSSAKGTEEQEDFWYEKFLEEQSVPSHKEESIAQKLARQEREVKAKRKKQQSGSDDLDELYKLDLPSVLQRIIELLKPKETIAGGLRRFGGIPETPKGRRPQGGKPQASNTPADPKAVDTLTTLANACTKLGYSTVYTLNREGLEQMLKDQSNFILNH